MAFVPSHHVRFLIDEFDFSGDSSGLSLTLTGNAIDAPAFQQTSLQRIPSETGLKIDHNGYFTGSHIGSLERELSSRLGTEALVRVGVLLDTRTIGNPAYVIRQAWKEQLTIETPIDGLLTLSGTWAEMPAYRGITLLDGKVTSPGNGAVIDLGSSSGNQGYLFLFCREIDGTSSGISISVESDSVSTMDSPSVLVTESFSGVGVVEAAISTSIERYVRIVVDSLGGANSFTATAVLCVNQVTM